MIEFSTTRRDTAAAGPNPAGITPSAHASAMRVHILGHYLRLADLRRRLANIIVAVPPSTRPGASSSTGEPGAASALRGVRPQPPS